MTLTVPETAAPRVTAVHKGRTAAIGAVAGVLLAVLWSAELVDKVIGQHVADALLGHDAGATAIAGTAGGLLFAFVSGLAGTFTACNIAMAASIGPLSVAGRDAGRPSARAFLRPVGYLTLGMVAVSATYGFVGVLLGDRLPQLSTATAGGMPVRIIQSAVVFGVIGLALAYLGLAMLGVLPDVFANRPAWRVVALGALIGGFLVGRPYPMFNKLFHWPADTGNPFYGAGALVLQSLGNVIIVTALFAILVAGTRGRFLRWLTGDPRRAMAIAGALLIALGVFDVVYWDLRVPAHFGYGWFPMAPYNM
ncbi:hypothetical protein [Dactylosporangium darangshiense]|uniref:Cytochrome C biogenesis protein transmembrane region n=1 Tax=Dactylosporangium darangshiense TaxID=579108 RepID=A0ABP8D734_9ACTN